MPTHFITGGSGLRLAVHDSGRRDGKPIVFIPGINQSSFAWHKQYGSSLAEEFRLLCLDLRGHGMSEKPTAPEEYNQATLWAEDVEAILTALSLHKPLVVGWSYGGYIINDYLAQYGEGAISGINYVCAGVALGGQKTGAMLGPKFLGTVPGLCSENLEDNIQAVRTCLRVLFEKQPSQEVFEVLLAGSMVVPPKARVGMFFRLIDRDSIMKRLELPVLVTSGDKDAVVTPAHTQRLLACIPHAQASVYQGVGHSPHLEEPERFNAELARFARQCAA